MFKKLLDSEFSFFSFRDVLAGVVIGLSARTLDGLFVTAMVWGVVAWFFIVLVRGLTGHTPKSPVTVRSIVSPLVGWWSIAFIASSLVGLITYAARYVFFS